MLRRAFVLWKAAVAHRLDDRRPNICPLQLCALAQSPALVIALPFAHTRSPMNHQLHFDLSAAARRTMLAHGFEPDYPPASPLSLTAARASAAA